MYYPFVRKVFLQFDPERVHEPTFQRLRRITGTPFEALVRQRVSARPVNCMGLTLKNPLSLTAGLDKDGECIDASDTMGFGSIEIGIVMLRPQPGDDKPCLFRLVGAEGLINCMGFNNLGVDNLVGNVKKAHYSGVLGTNIGKNEDTPVEQGKNDYLIRMEKIYAYAGYIAINISSLDTPGSRTLQYGEVLDDLLTVIKNKQNDLQVMHYKYASIIVKIVSDLSEEESIQVADSLVCHNIDGVIVTNTTLDRSLVQGMKNCDQTGGLGGRPLQLKSIEIICRSSQELNGRLPIIGVDGIDPVIVAREKIVAGALLVQIYLGFISKGPPLTKEIVTYI